MKLILLPGLDGTGAMLEGFAEELGKVHDVQSVTYPTDRELDYPALAKSVVAQLPKGSPFVIVAESFSGPVAAIVGAAHPEGLAGIVFVASFAAKPNRLPRTVGALAQFVPIKTGLLLRLARPFLFGRWATPAMFQLFNNTVAQVASEVLAFRLRQVMSADYLAEVAAITVPMRYLRPRHDRLVTATAFGQIAKANPRVSLVEIDGPHFILQVRPGECAQLVRHFLTE
jgi:pimeloyl-[acyl-carrier protein] methyl ester esterase